MTTCRIGPYKALKAVGLRAKGAAQVTIRPVTTAAARRFILARVQDRDDWRAVLDELRPGGRLARLGTLSNPWRLMLAVTFFEERDGTGATIRDPNDLMRLSPGGVEELQEVLLNHFVGAAIAARYPDAEAAPFTVQETTRWLAQLAGRLSSNQFRTASTAALGTRRTRDLNGLAADGIT